MRKIKIFYLIVIISILFLGLQGCNVADNGHELDININDGMKITSDAFEDNQNIPAKYTCDGQDISPPLDFSGVPPEAESLALIMEDPDAPAKAWIHWVVWNIDPDALHMPEDTKPQGGIEGINDFGSQGYGGPCPPSEKHRYVFKLYALDMKIGLDPSSSAGDLAEAMAGHVIDSAELLGIYGRD